MQGNATLSDINMHALALFNVPFPSLLMLCSQVLSVSTGAQIETLAPDIVAHFKSQGRQ
jgi:hypothetical protein